MLNAKILFYYNAADVVLLTSLWEGSPNVIKESMACNRPIVSTNVGDVNMLLKHVESSFIVNPDSKMISEKINILLNNSKPSNGRMILRKLELDSEHIAIKLIMLYNNTIYGK